jgi:uncharacterized protein (DUF2225 family)
MFSTHERSEFLELPVTCPACRAEFITLQVKSNLLKPVRRHTDFHVEYAGPSPIHYVVVVCPECYYASYRSDFDELHGSAKQRIQATGEKRKEKFDTYNFIDVRDYDTVQSSYELALHCYLLRKKIRFGLRAALYLHMAWLAREAGMPDRETYYIRRALENYRDSFLKDHSDSLKDEIKQTYLAGELALRLKRYKEAVGWFEKTIHHPQIKEFPGLERQTRERWADAREDSAKRLSYKD